MADHLYQLITLGNYFRNHINWYQGNYKTGAPFTNMDM